MEITLRIHSSPRNGTRVWCYAMWWDGGGRHEAHLLEKAGTVLGEASEDGPWVLLARAYAELARVKSLKAGDSTRSAAESG